MYVEGHVDVATVTPSLQAAFERERFGNEWPFEAGEVAHLWMRYDSEREDATAYWCEAGEPGAIAVTGVRMNG
ncbi:hypothetical protein BA190_26820 [Labrys sp. WJW]|nr:hypothetical protein BA190_26820 [Labrys sp. WJW]